VVFYVSEREKLRGFGYDGLEISLVMDGWFLGFARGEVVADWSRRLFILRDGCRRVGIGAW
jgi:hypothetical protein